jgi:hypothetical protein
MQTTVYKNRKRATGISQGKEVIRKLALCHVMHIRADISPVRMCGLNSKRQTRQTVLFVFFVLYYTMYLTF